MKAEFTLPIFEEELQKKINHSSHLINQICETGHEKAHLKNRIISANLVQKYAFIKDSAFNDSIFKKIILDSCEKAERMSGGAGELCFRIVSGLLEQYLPMVRSGVCPRSIRESVWASLDINLKALERESSTVTKTVIENIINDSFDDNCLRLIVKSAIRLAGKNREIRIEKSNFQQTHIFLRDGCNFPITTQEYFLGNSLSWERKDVTCIVIDGTIVEVSEVHHLLEKHAEEKTPCVIFARHFSPDVINTLLANKKRGSLDVIPISVGMTEGTVNILSDIAACCGCDVVSSLKGELISTAVKEILPVVDKIKIKKNSTFIQNRKSLPNVRRQISTLKDRQDGTTKEAVVALLEKRIRSLTSDTVYIRVGSNILNTNPITIEEMDMFFRKLSAFIRFGMIDFDKTNDKFLKSQSRFLKESIFPTSSLISANKIAASTVFSILSTGCSIIQDI